MRDKDFLGWYVLLDLLQSWDRTRQAFEWRTLFIMSDQYKPSTTSKITVLGGGGQEFPGVANKQLL